MKEGTLYPMTPLHTFTYFTTALEVEHASMS